MFERYTEHARRALFFARHVASQVGSRTIETEHLLLGLSREAGPLITCLAPSVSIEDLRQKIRKNIDVREKVKASIQMPLSTECKRILSYSAEEADRLGDSDIGVEHLLVAVLREEKCLGARLLRDMGVRLESVWECWVREKSSREGPALPGVLPLSRDRAAVHALIDELPETQLARVKLVISRMRAASQKRPEIVDTVRRPHLDTK